MEFAPRDYPAELLAARGSPCLSLYQPTHRQFPDNRQDPIRFRNLLKQLSESLHQKFPQQTGESLLAPFEHLGRTRRTECARFFSGISSAATGI